MDAKYVHPKLAKNLFSESFQGNCLRTLFVQADKFATSLPENEVTANTSWATADYCGITGYNVTTGMVTLIFQTMMWLGEEKEYGTLEKEYSLHEIMEYFDETNP